MNENDLLQQAKTLIAALGQQKSNFFMLTWEGSKIPRGAVLGGVGIGWTQHGMVTGTGGEQLGYYDRIEEFGGETGQRQVMLIATDAVTLIPPPGGQVTPVEKVAPSAELPPQFEI